MRMCFLAVILLVLLTMCFGCVSGGGLHKKATLMPDEFSISSDFNPEKNMECDEITFGFKWKLK